MYSPAMKSAAAELRATADWHLGGVTEGEHRSDPAVVGFAPSLSCNLLPAVTELSGTVRQARRPDPFRSNVIDALMPI